MRSRPSSSPVQTTTTTGESRPDHVYPSVFQHAESRPHTTADRHMPQRSHSDIRSLPCPNIPRATRFSLPRPAPRPSDDQHVHSATMQPPCTRQSSHPSNVSGRSVNGKINLLAEVALADAQTERRQPPSSAHRQEPQLLGWRPPERKPTSPQAASRWEHGDRPKEQKTYRFGEVSQLVTTSTRAG